MSDNREIARGIVEDAQDMRASEGFLSLDHDRFLREAIAAALDAATERGRMQGWIADEATVERVARASFEAMPSISIADHSIQRWEDIGGVMRDVYRTRARAAIAAIPAPPAPEGE